MNIDPVVVDELRTVFRDGATPSRLIRRIAERHSDVSASQRHWLVQDYFREAFDVPIVRGLPRQGDYRPRDLQYAFLNHRLVHAMLEHKPHWQSGGAPGAEVQDWTDSLTATSDEQRFEAARASVPPELADSWNQLSGTEQDFICRTMASENGLYETVQILAALAERLQQKIMQLEGDGTAGPTQLETKRLTTHE